MATVILDYEHALQCLRYLTNYHQLSDFGNSRTVSRLNDIRCLEFRKIASIQPSSITFCGNLRTYGIHLFSIIIYGDSNLGAVNEVRDAPREGRIRRSVTERDSGPVIRDVGSKYKKSRRVDHEYNLNSSNCNHLVSFARCRQ